MANTESGLELLVPTVTDVVIKYTWLINKYSRSFKKRDTFDSPSFEYNANGIHTRWNMSIRFWRGPNGKKIKNPVVVCLNLLGVSIEEQAQTRVRFQFGIYNQDVKQWELCHVSRVVLNLESTSELLSIGHRDLSILDRHISRPEGNVSMFVKIQLSPTEADNNTLSQDLSRILGSGGDVVLRCDSGEEFRAHGVLLRARSTEFSAMLDEEPDGKQLAIPDVSPEILRELLRYVYTDHADNIDTMAPTLLAAADRFNLPGLKLLCERSLLETITPESVASLLLVADQFNCESLKRTLLTYCEDNASVIKKSYAWKVMEMVNPDLFIEVCETSLGSSMSSDLESLESDSGIAGL